MENCKKFLDDVAMKLNIKTPRDWGKVSQRDFYKLGGSSLLSHYNSSIFDCLQSIYKGSKLCKLVFIIKILNGKESGSLDLLGCQSNAGNQKITTGRF